MNRQADNLSFSADEAAILDRLAEGECMATRMRALSRQLTRGYGRFFRAVAPLTITQFGLMATLADLHARGEPGTMASLAKRFELDRTTLSRALPPLQRQGLIEILPGADRRNRLITITEKGIRHMQRALPAWKAAQDAFLGRFGAQNWDEMRHLMDELAVICEEMEQTPPPQSASPRPSATAEDQAGIDTAEAKGI